MKEEVYAPDPLNPQAGILVDAQTDIKTAIKNGVLGGKGRDAVKNDVAHIIERAVARIRSPTLKRDGRVSLMRFADKAYRDFTDALSVIKPNILPAIIVLMRGITARERVDKTFTPSTDAERSAAGKVAASEGLSYAAYNKGIPLQEFQKKYIDRVSVALNELADSRALDPNDNSGRNTLRNLAEMQVRYERHQEEIAGFKERGTRLVVCSVHADCSDRCAEWQGLVYSLDGTYGVTDDGKEFQPLENATERNYTKRGVPNGLLGFNCRHKLYEYKAGMVIPKVDAQTQRREYEITQTQRKLERDVIAAREKALEFKHADIREYRLWRKTATRRFMLYKSYSKEMGRAYYPDRVKIL